MNWLLELRIYLIIESDDPDRQYLKALLKKINKPFNESRPDVIVPQTPGQRETDQSVLHLF